MSVVIPTLNEQRTLVECLDSVGEGRGLEIVVSDGGSRDSTLEIARAREGVQIVEGSPGRGPQLNRGAAATGGEMLLFLHADCRLPASWRSMVENALSDEATSLACFRLLTEPTHATGPFRRAWLRILDLRSMGLGLPYGDQGFALRRESSTRWEGFPIFRSWKTWDWRGPAAAAAGSNVCPGAFGPRPAVSKVVPFGAG